MGADEGLEGQEGHQEGLGPPHGVVEAHLQADAGEVRGAVGGHGGDALAKPVSEWMTENVVTCKPEDTITEVMQKMTSGRFRHLPVVEDEVLLGIVSIGDVVKRRIADVEREASEMRNYIAMA